MEQLKIIGISTGTSNQDGQAAQDLGKLWERFYTDQIIDKIPGKADNEVYSIYTDYESDYTGKYTALIGMKVSLLDEVPEGLVGRAFDDQHFRKYTAKGAMPNAVAETWKHIWDNDENLNRSYTYDFERYGEKSQNGENSEVDIFIAVKA